MNVTPRDLLDAGVHFGHQTKRWNPRFKEFLFDHRQGISIIDLATTHKALEDACRFLENHVADGADVLIVGTKRQAQEIVREAAAAVNMPFCANRWMGGTLTNFETIKRSIAKYKRYQDMEASGELGKMHKKEAAAIKREMGRMLRNFEGLAGRTEIPGAMIVVDVNHEDIAVSEGRRLNLPVVALVDTNSDPGTVTHPIPGNDDAVKSIRIILETLVEAIQSGLSQRESRRIAQGKQQLSEASPIAAPIQPIIPGAPAPEPPPEAARPPPAAPAAAPESAPDEASTGPVEEQQEEDLAPIADEDLPAPERVKAAPRAGDDEEETRDSD